MATTTAMFKGELYLRPISAAISALLSTGNATKVALSSEIEEKSIPNTMTPGGGNHDSFKRVKAAKLSLQFRNMTKQTLEIAFGAKVTAVAGGSVVDEAHNNIVLGGLIKTDERQDVSAPMTVKKASAVLAEGTDYQRKRAGIIPLAGGALANDDDITISYTSLPVVRIDGLMNTTKEFYGLFDGINERTSQPVMGEFYRMAFGPATNIDLVGDEFISFDCEAELLADDTKAATESPFFHFEMGGVS